MFRLTTRNLAVWWADFSDDILGADLPDDMYAEAVDEVGVGVEADLDHVDYHRTHPHRVPVAARRLHRPGQVPERPAFCLSPVRTAPARGSGARRDAEQMTR